MNRIFKIFALLGFAAGVFLGPATSQAGIFKCVDARGGTTYSQTPCPVHTQSIDVSTTVKSSTNTQDCRIARNFFNISAKKMRSGVTSGALFDQFGGIDSMPAESVGMINYVYTYQSNPGVSVGRIASLATMRCEAGSFGKTSCENFPFGFIESLGGCEAAVLPGGRPGFASPQTAEAAASGVQLNKPVPAAARYSSDFKESCKDTLEAQLKVVGERMRQRQSAQQQSGLRAQQLDLRKRLSRC